MRQPSMFLAGELDGLNQLTQPDRGAMASQLLDLRSLTCWPA